MKNQNLLFVCLRLEKSFFLRDFMFTKLVQSFQPYFLSPKKKSIFWEDALNSFSFEDVFRFFLDFDFF